MTTPDPRLPEVLATARPDQIRRLLEDIRSGQPSDPPRPGRPS